MIHRFRIPGILFMVALVTACEPDDYTQAQSSAEKTTNSSIAASINRVQRTVPFITLRNKTGSNKAADYFGEDRSIRRAGECILTRKPLKVLKSIADNASFYIPDDIVTLDAIKDRPLKNFWPGLEMSANASRPVLYTHGYFMSFERSCKRALVFQESLGLAGRFLLLSWPSDGAIFNYTRDESDLYWSVVPMAETLTEMVEHFGPGSFDVISHSLGTRGVFLALVLLAGKEPATRPWINQLVLVAPDIDIGIFKQHLPQIRMMAENITIYVSGNDKPLTISRQIHGRPRLGESGTHLEGLAGVNIIDLTEIPVSYPSGHVYHLYNKIVATDLVQLLDAGKPASQRANLKKIGESHWLLQVKVDNDDG